MKKGKLIVIDGNEGSGKATQSKLLIERFGKIGKKAEHIDFPRYQDNFFGRFIGQCIVGEHGDFVNSDPYIASVLYASDRFESLPKIKLWLKKGRYVISDRYVSANQIHQGGKIKDLNKRRAFLKWLDQMEFEIFKMPKPDIIIYLDVPVSISQNLLQEKKAKLKKKYLKGRKDTLEENLRYLANARQSAEELSKDAKNFVKIKCAPDGKLLPAEVIHQEIYNKLKSYLRI